MKKHATLFLITVLTVSSLLIVKTVQVSAVLPKPSVPEFTLKYIDNSYDVPPTYGKDPYTGETVMIHAGYHVENKSIEVIIKNQHFTSYLNEDGSLVGLFYNIRFKGHFENWTNYNPDWTTYTYYPTGYVYRSDSDYTVVAYGLTGNTSSESYSRRLIATSAGGQVDFRVEAIIGYSTRVNDPMVPGIPVGDPTDPVPRHYVFTGETSGWSDTQTVTINKTQTSMPSSELVDVILGVVIVAVVLGTVFGLLIYFKKRTR
jgi:hypothetical protein